MTKIFWLCFIGCMGVAPTWPAGAQMSFDELGIGVLQMSWPEANNNQLSLVGYEVSITDTGNQVTVLVYNGTGLPTIQEFLYDAFVPGDTYQVGVVAISYDPVGLTNLVSNELIADYTLSLPVSFDPTQLTDSSYSWVSGVQSVLSIHSRHPQSGFYQTVGPICSVQTDASCIPGRTFVAYIDNLCNMNAGVYDCVPVSVGDTGWAASPWLGNITRPAFVATSVDNTPYYNLTVTPLAAGSFSLLVQSITPNSVLAVYWDNEEFLGDPADIEAVVGIDFAYGSNNIVVWSTEYVSVRFLAYLVPVVSNTYELSCLAATTCSVWVDDLPVLVSQLCSTGCTLGAFTFAADEYYRIRVDYATVEGNSFVHLQWRIYQSGDAFVSIPSSLLYRGQFVTGSPFPLSVVPGAMTGSQSFVYGSAEAMSTPYAGRPYNLFIKVKDDAGNACTSFLLSDTVQIQVGSSPLLSATPLNPLVLDCVYVVQLVFENTGSTAITGLVNSNLVSNTPFSVNVQTGPPDSQTSVLYGSSTIEVDAVSVSIQLLDVYGNTIPSGFDIDTMEISATIQQSATLVNTVDGCGTRSDFTWKISCWSGEFRYVDDALIIGQTVPRVAQLHVVLEEIEAEAPGPPPFRFVETLLRLLIFHSLYAGLLDLTVTFGQDSIVSGGPIVLTALTTTTLVVPAMCLVQFDGIVVRVAVIEETPITATVLIRDIAGNVLDRPSELVELVVSADFGVTRFICFYVTGKYYSCAGYSVFPGATVVTVEVNSVQASMTSGTPPSQECIAIAACGTVECPCMQTRTVAEMTFFAENFP